MKKQRNKTMRNEKVRPEILSKEIADVKAKAENLSQVNEHLGKEFEDFVYEVDKNPERVSLLVSKATASRRKSDENKNDLKKLEETTKVLEKKWK